MKKFLVIGVILTLLLMSTSMAITAPEQEAEDGFRWGDRLEPVAANQLELAAETIAEAEAYILGMEAQGYDASAAWDILERAQINYDRAEYFYNNGRYLLSITFSRVAYRLALFSMDDQNFVPGSSGGLPYGASCNDNSECESGICLAAGTCGCSSNADCSYPQTCDISGFYGTPNVCV